MEATAHSYFTGNRTIGLITYPGVSIESNVYILFIYRALDYWCSIADEVEEKTAGKLAFVIPLNFCAADYSAALRKLFAPGGRWTIKEIVDMELIWRHVFDADVLPMILFAEARPPREDDKVTVRHVNEDSGAHDPANRKARPVFTLPCRRKANLPTQTSSRLKAVSRHV